MADVDIKARVSVDTGGAQQQIGNTKKAVQGLGDEVKKASGGSFDKLKGSLQGVGPAAMEAAKGSNLFNTALNVLKANPIILVVTILVGLIFTLFERFKKMEGVSDALGKAWGALSGVMDAFINKILTPMIDGFVKLVELFTNGVIWVLDKLGITSAETAKRFGEITEALDDLEDAEKDAALAIAASNRKLQEAREIAGDANVPIRERIKALKEAARIEKEETDRIVEINRMKSALLLEQMAMELGARENLLKVIRQGSLENLKIARAELMSMKNIDKEKIAQIDALIIAAEDAAAKSAKIGKRTQAQITSMEKEEQDKRKAQHEAYVKAKADREAQIEAAKNQRLLDIEAAHQLRMKQIENERRLFMEKSKKQEFDVSTSTIQALADQQIRASAQAAEAQKRDAEAVAAWEKMTAEQRAGSIAAVGQATQAVGQIIGEQTAAGKALGIATATINTYQGVTEALKQKSVLPSPFDVIAKVANVAAVLASGLTAVRNITRVNIPGRSGGGGSIPGGGGLTATAPIAPSLGATSLNAGSIQAVGNAAAGGSTRAFVLESDIANNRERIERLNRAARI